MSISSVDSKLLEGRKGISSMHSLNLLQLLKLGESCSVMSDSLQPHGLYSLCNSPGQNTGVGSLSLLQGIFPTQGLNPGLPHCRRILYQLSYQGGQDAQRRGTNGQEGDMQLPLEAPPGTERD